MQGDDSTYYSVVDVDSTQFSANLSARWKKLESALEAHAFDSLNSGVAVNLLSSRKKGDELCHDLRQVYDILFYEEFDDMDKFVKFRNYYAQLKTEYDSMLTAIDKLLNVEALPQVSNKTLFSKL